MDGYRCRSGRRGRHVLTAAGARTTGRAGQCRRGRPGQVDSNGMLNDAGDVATGRVLGGSWAYAGSERDDGCDGSGTQRRRAMWLPGSVFGSSWAQLGTGEQDGGQWAERNVDVGF